jgi:hypothetical protein
MTQRDPGVYLEDIEYYASAAVRFLADATLDQYLADEKTRAAVERVLELCGEAMNNLNKIAPAGLRIFRTAEPSSVFATSWLTATPSSTTTRFTTSP